MSHTYLQGFDLPDYIHDEIEKFKVNRKYKKKNHVFSAGESSDGVFILKRGLIAIVYNSDTGGEHLLRLIKANQFFGYRSVLSEENYQAHAICLEDSEVYFIEKKNFYDLLERYHQLSFQFLKHLSLQIKNCEQHRIMITEKEVIVRAAQSIVYLMQVSSTHKWTRNDIARYCESTTATIIKALGILEEKKLIQQEGHKIIILDQEGLINFKHNE